MAEPTIVKLAEKLGTFDERWSPRIVGELNGQEIKLVKIQGEFVWHHHDDADELFLVLEGELTIDFPEDSVRFGPGELCIVPRGVEHRPRAEVETHLLLFEPAGTLNTGNVSGDRTVERPLRI